MYFLDCADAPRLMNKAKQTITRFFIAISVEVPRQSQLRLGTFLFLNFLIPDQLLSEHIEQASSGLTGFSEFQYPIVSTYR